MFWRERHRSFANARSSKQRRAATASYAAAESAGTDWNPSRPGTPAHLRGIDTVTCCRPVTLTGTSETQNTVTRRSMTG